MTNNEELKKFLYEYIIHQQSRAENNYNQWLENIKMRVDKPDEIDMLECILAINELKVTNKILNDVVDIIRIFG